MNMPIVTLTTDWGQRDHFVAMVKGRLCRLIEGVRVMDLSHAQDWNDPYTTASIMRHGCLAFPSGTVHVVDVCCDQLQLGQQRREEYQQSLVAQWRGHYFVCSSRKLLELALDEEEARVVSLPFPAEGASNTFLAYSQYCDVAAALCRGAVLDDVGVACGALRRRMPLQAQVDGNRLETLVIGLDAYGNANLNVTYADFEAIRAGRAFRVELEWSAGKSERCDAITGICRHYSDVSVGSMLLTVSVTGLLQLAVNRDSTAKLVGLSRASRCRFIFMD